MQELIKLAPRGVLAAAEDLRFVINLLSSTTPVALAQPGHPSLKPYTFYITRRKQDHRERFRLHMGFFSSQQEAEQLLAAVREIFPSAWAGLAPGREETRPSGELRPVRAAAPDLPHVAVAFESAADAAPPAAPAAPAEPSAPGIELRLVDEPATAGGSAADAGAAATPREAAQIEATQSLCSVRNAIAALDDGAPGVGADDGELQLVPDSQVLRILEDVVPPAAQVPRPAAPAAPRRADPAPQGEVANGGFSVQLMWSALAIDVTQLPYLAIFESYTLYMAEGSRDGRRWFGLRLGFFNDAASARQVALYLRPEFKSVAVVPISGGERERALQATRALAPSPEAPPRETKEAEEYQLVDDPPPLTPQASHALLESPTPKPVAQQLRRPPQTLEETIEALGGGQLRADPARRGELLNDSAVRSLRRAADRREPERGVLGRLFSRLGDRLKTG